MPTIDPNIAKLVNDVVSAAWWVLVTFWTISGAFSSVATRMWPPYTPHPGETLTPLEKLCSTRFYRYLYRAVNLIAQNLGFARNSVDPTWRVGIETTIRVLASIIATGGLGAGAEAGIKKAADLDAELTEKSDSNQP